MPCKVTGEQAKLDVVNAGPTDEDLQAAQSSVTQSQQQLFLAAQPNTAQDIQAQRDAIAQAQGASHDAVQFGISQAQRACGFAAESHDSGR